MNKRSFIPELKRSGRVDRQLFGRADNQAADDGAGDRGKAAQDQHGQGFERDEGERELHAVTRAPQKAGDQGDQLGAPVG